MIRIEHIGIAVKDLAKAEETYSRLLGGDSYKREEVASEGVIPFFQVGPNKIELLESTRPDGPIAKTIGKRGEGIHHIAFEVADIRAEMDRLKTEGFTLLNEEPKRGADNKLVCFVHPKSANGVLVELCQEIRNNMGTKKDTAAYILECLGQPGRFSVKAMFGEFALYADGKTVGFICDDQLLVKITPESAALEGRCERAPAYPGSKDYFLVPEDLLVGERLLPALLLRMAEVLPLPKARKRKG